MKIIYSQGLPGSGKSTWAKQFVQDNPTYVRINRDDLRNMRGKYWVPKQEDYITDVQYAAIQSALDKGYNIICDDTFLNPKAVKHLNDFVNTYNNSTGNDVKVECKSFTSVKPTQCIKYDKLRQAQVGEDVIWSMYFKYLWNYKLYEPLPNTLQTIIVDIDGTIAKHVDRNPYQYELAGSDEVIEDVARVVKAMSHVVEVMFVTGRPDNFHDITRKWLDDNGFKGSLHMREEGDRRPDYIVKAEVVESISTQFEIVGAFEDRKQVKEMYRKGFGITCFHIDEGNF